MITMARLHPFIAKLLAGLAASAIVLGLTWSEPVAQGDLRPIASKPMDPLWPDHLRCLVLGAEAADDRICAALSAVDWER